MSAQLGLNIKNKLADMQIGDCIPCRYTATTSGVAGSFSELGTCTANEISVTGTATPDGLFYFIKTDTGKLIADRVLQTSISWDALNNAKFIEGGLYVDTIKIDDSTITAFGSGGSYVAGTTSPQKLFNGIVSSSNMVEGYQVTQGLTRLYVGGITSQSFKLYKIRYYPYSSGDYQPVNFTIEGSTDTTTGLDGTWETIKTFTNLAYAPAGAWAEIIIDSLKSYNAYRYNITSTGSNRIYFFLNELEFYAIEDSNFSKQLIRSISGGCAYADANGNETTTDQSKGGWPTNNEWDKYILNSDLGGKITPGDDNIWHKMLCWTKDTPITATFTSSTGITLVSANTNRVCRGTNTNGGWHDFGIAISTTINAGWGFRPVLEFIESNSKQSNLWY